MTATEFEKLVTSYESKVFDIIDASMKAAMYQAKQAVGIRIFEDNQNMKGESFGSYKSEAYKKFRKSKGKQTAKVDLQLSGTLARSISDVVSSNGYSVILKPTKEPNERGGTSNVTSDKLARYQDERYGQTFYANKQEINEAVKAANIVFNERTKQVFKLS